MSPYNRVASGTNKYSTKVRFLWSVSSISEQSMLIFWFWTNPKSGKKFIIFIWEQGFIKGRDRQWGRRTYEYSWDEQNCGPAPSQQWSIPQAYESRDVDQLEGTWRLLGREGMWGTASASAPGCTCNWNLVLDLIYHSGQNCVKKDHCGIWFAGILANLRIWPKRAKSSHIDCGRRSILHG